MMMTAVWPRSWNWQSLRRGTVWPRWTSIPVGSMPYLTRSGLPVLTLRSSFLRSSSSGTTCSTPRRIRTSCSSTGFTRASAIELEAIGRLKGARIMGDCRLAAAGRPTDGEHVEAGRVAEQLLVLEEVQRELRQAALLVEIDRGGGAGQV